MDSSRPQAPSPPVPLRPPGRTTVRPAPANRHVQSFLTGAGPTVVGAIAGSAVPLALALTHAWQFGVLAAAALWLLLAGRGVVSALLGAGLLGVAAALSGWAV